MILNRDVVLLFKKHVVTLFIALSLISLSTCSTKNENLLSYDVYYTTDSLIMDANWDKSQWQNVQAIKLNNFMGEKPKFWPETEVKMLYNENYIYVIFRVHDRYVKAVATHINAPVYHDSAVEFFFTPGSDISYGYFNLEVNCGGTPYFKFQKGFKKNVINIDFNDIKTIKMAHSLPQLIEDEIKTPVTWTLEYKIPVQMLSKYTEITPPQPGVVWRANFYKTADATSNPHYLTWNKVKNDSPNFHLPQFFGMIRFQ